MQDSGLPEEVEQWLVESGTPRAGWEYQMLRVERGGEGSLKIPYDS
jgi:hypothetical protein